jgi:hypothetical protein
MKRTRPPAVEPAPTPKRLAAPSEVPSNSSSPLSDEARRFIDYLVDDALRELGLLD